jgi:hypothetical protein
MRLSFFRRPDTSHQDDGHPDEGFNAQLQEARAAIARNFPVVDRADIETATTHLSAAQSFHKKGDLAKAWSFLNFARGKLDLPVQPRDDAAGRKGRSAC